MADAAFWNLHVWGVPRKYRVLRGQNPLLMDFLDEQLRQRYRFGRDSIMYLSYLLRDKLERLTRRKTSLTVDEKVMIALRFVASGSHLQVIGDTMGHDKSTISRVIRQVADALVEMKDTFIIWPQTPEKLNPIKNGFYQKAGFPNVVGCIDTIGYHRNYSGRWLVAIMSASKSTSLMRDFTSLSEFDLMFMFAVKSYLHSWCFQCSSRQISNYLTVFACITDSGRLFHISTILTTKVYLLTFSLLVFIFIFLLCPLVFEVVFSSNISTVVRGS